MALAQLGRRASAELAGLVEADTGAIGASRSTLFAKASFLGGRALGEAIEAALVARGILVIGRRKRRESPGRDDLAATGAGPLRANRVAVPRARALNPPSPGDAAKACSNRPRVVEGLIHYLVKKGTLVRLPGGWLIARAAVDDVAARLRASGKSSLDVGEFKEMFGLTAASRSRCSNTLDATKVTRRIADRREIL